MTKTTKFKITIVMIICLIATIKKKIRKFMIFFTRKKYLNSIWRLKLNRMNIVKKFLEIIVTNSIPQDPIQKECMQPKKLGAKQRVMNRVNTIMAIKKINRKNK
jgi:hypothetical protein